MWWMSLPTRLHPLLTFCALLRACLISLQLWLFLLCRVAYSIPLMAWFWVGPLRRSGLSLALSWFYVVGCMNDTDLFCRFHLSCGDGMANFKFLIGAVCLLSVSAHALYVTPSVPENFKTIGGVGHLSISPSDTSFANGIRSKIAGGAARVALAGGGADIPVAYKFAATAGKAAASFAFGWPGVFLALGGIAYSYFTEEDFFVIDDVWKKRVPGGSLYRVSNNPWETSADAACSYHVALLNATHNPPIFEKMSLSNETNCYISLWGTEWSHPPITKQDQLESLRTVDQNEFEADMQGKPIPLGVPQAWPSVAPMWWPVQNPILSPSPVNPADPQAVPVPTPLRVPQGDPVPVTPATDPATWKSPVVDIIPSPTPDNPWRVDVQPKDITTTSPEPLAPDVVTPTDPTGEPTQEQLDLCALHPEILACQKLDNPDDVPELQQQDISVSISPDSGWGSSSGSCPAPRPFATAGGATFSFQPICDFASGIRPVIIAVAWLSAALILLGVKAD